MIFLLCFSPSIPPFIIASAPSSSLFLILVTEGQVIRNIPRSVKWCGSVLPQSFQGDRYPDLRKGISVVVKMQYCVLIRGVLLSISEKQRDERMTFVFMSCFGPAEAALQLFRAVFGGRIHGPFQVWC